MEIRRAIHSITSAKVSIAPLVTFRVLFGLIMLASVIRFWLNGWIETQYIEPSFHFKYFGFYWVPEISETGLYIVFSAMAVSALGIALGAFYRVSAVLFFLSFTYVELLDATYYLNHYYFVSLVALLLIFLPGNRMHALDVKLGFAKAQNEVAAWAINSIKFQLILVYFLAGLAKLNADWLLNAMPLAIWLPAQDQLPIIGWLMPYKATAVLFSWAGALYDLFIPLLLIIKPTRWLAYIAVIVFHVLTYVMFQIGMFPFIMMGATLIFFSAGFHQKIHALFGFHQKVEPVSYGSECLSYPFKIALTLFVALQILIPFRHVLYPGNPFWHEQGYRFGWRVMLMEKAGYAQFKVQDTQGNVIEVDNTDFLTPVQEKMMSTQADFMLQYADFLKAYHAKNGVTAAAVKADVYVTFNGRSSRRFIDPDFDLTSVRDGFENKTWILPFTETTGEI
jgi:hypothetical protein